MIVLYRYIVVGIANTILSLVLIYGLMFFFNLNPLVSNFIGYFFGFILGYLMNSKWTFKSNGMSNMSILLYLIVILSAYLANIFLVNLLLRVFEINSYIAQIFGAIIYSLISFIGCKKIAFSERN